MHHCPLYGMHSFCLLVGHTSKFIFVKIYTQIIYSAGLWSAGSADILIKTSGNSVTSSDFSPFRPFKTNVQVFINGGCTVWNRNSLPAKLEIDFRFFTTFKFSVVYVHERGKRKSAALSYLYIFYETFVLMGSGKNVSVYHDIREHCWEDIQTDISQIFKVSLQLSC